MSRITLSDTAEIFAAFEAAKMAFAALEAVAIQRLGEDCADDLLDNIGFYKACRAVNDAENAMWKCCKVFLTETEDAA